VSGRTPPEESSLLNPLYTYQAVYQGLFRGAATPRFDPLKPCRMILVASPSSRRPYYVALIASPLSHHSYCRPHCCPHCLIPQILWRAPLLRPAEQPVEVVVVMLIVAILRARFLLFLKSALVRPLMVESRSARRRGQMQLNQNLLPASQHHAKTGDSKSAPLIDSLTIKLAADVAQAI